MLRFTLAFETLHIRLRKGFFQAEHAKFLIAYSFFRQWSLNCSFGIEQSKKSMREAKFVGYSFVFLLRHVNLCSVLQLFTVVSSCPQIAHYAFLHFSVRALLMVSL